MPFKWTPEAETKLLLAVIKHSDAKPSSEIFEKIAAAIGPGANANACSQRFHKLKREADVILTPTNDSGTGSGSAAPPVTPTSGKKNATAKKTPATSARKRKLADDIDGASATPSKKAAKGKAKHDTSVVDEQDDEGKGIETVEEQIFSAFINEDED